MIYKIYFGNDKSLINPKLTTYLINALIELTKLKKQALFYQKLT